MATGNPQSYEKRIQTSNEIWRVTFNNKGKKKIEFLSSNCISFLENHGFARFKSPELGDLNFGFVYIDNGVAKVVADFEIRDFVYDYVSMNCKDNDVIKYFLEHLSAMLSKAKLERLRRIEIVEMFEPDYQMRHYINGSIRITAEEISFGLRSETVWRQNVLGRSFKRIPVIKDVQKLPDGSFKVVATEQGDKCEFLQYLTNTSNFSRTRIRSSSQRWRGTAYICTS